MASTALDLGSQTHLPLATAKPTAELALEFRAPAAAQRNNLSHYMRQELDARLTELGAPGERSSDSQNLADWTSGLLARVRALGFGALALCFPSLYPIARAGALSVIDSRTLRWWLDDSPGEVRVVLSADTLELRAHLATVPVAELLASPLGSPVQAHTSMPTAHASTPAAQSPVPDEAHAVDGAAGPASERRALASEATTEPDDLTFEPTAEPDHFAFDDDSEVPLVNTGEAPHPTDVAASTQPRARAQESEAAHVTLWREALRTATGVQSWEDLERLYIANYLPLVHLLADGQGNASVETDAATWAAEFQRCYEAAFERLCRGKQRPAMVMDVPQTAYRLATELRASAVHMILVDGMRFDVGQRVHDKLRLQLSDHAYCARRGVLWSALPCTTAVQLELLARGPTGLRGFGGAVDEKRWLAHGTEARKLRKLKVGPHTMWKLDVLQAEFATSAWGRESRDAAAAAVATSIGRFVRQQSNGTLVLLFGDHGMCSADACDAHPENVLVPLDAWHVGEPA